MADEKVIDLARLDRFHSNLKSNGLPMNDWQVNKKYKVGYVVIYNGNQYRCTVEHTSTSTFDTSKWELTSSSGGVDLPEWQANTSYTAGKYLVHEGTVYKVDNDFTSGTTFSDTSLISYIAPIMQGATSSIDGKAGMVIKPTTTDVDKFLKGDGTWGSAGGGISIWQANTAYNVNDVVIDSNLIWQCATAHTSTTTFDESKWICISGGEISNGLEIVPLWEGDYNSTGTSTAQQLADSVVKYEYLLITFNGRQESGWENKQTFICKVSDITEFNVPLFRFAVYAENNAYTSISIGFTDYTHFYNHYFGSTSWSIPSITSIQGIRKAKPIVSSGMKYETLWEGEAGNLSGEGNTTINLSESIKRYQKFGVQVKCFVDNMYRYYYREFDTDYFLDWLTSTISGDNGFTMTWGYANYNDYVNILHDSTDSQIKISYRYTQITKITGISEGVQIPTGVQAARVTLFEGNHTSSSNITISDDYTNYDELEFYCGTVIGSRYDYIVAKFSKQELDNTLANNTYCIILGFNGENREIQATNDKKQFVLATGMPIYKIVGIKYIQPDSYSTEEKLIGTWIDGKQLYRVTITGNTGSGGDIDYPIDYNIDKIISAECMLENSDGSSFRPLTYYAGGDYASIICQKTRFHVYLNGISNFTYYLTLKYTKN